MKAVVLVSLALLGCGASSTEAPAKNSAAPATKPAPKTAEPSLPTDLEARAGALVDALRGRQFARVARELDARMSRLLDADQLGQAWGDATAALGAFRARGDVRRQRTTAGEIVIVTCQFERGGIDIKLVFDPERRISGLWLSLAWTPPPYADLGRFSERDVSVGSAPWSVPGTLTLPKADAPRPGVVLVHGSGPQDRDETLGPNKPFKDLAWGLASRGIAVLRYDKRTRVHLDAIRDSKVAFTVAHETVDDALAAVAVLRSSDGVDPARVHVLGHSMGGSLLPRIGARDPELAGLIGLAAGATPPEAAIVAQFRYIFALDGKLDDDEKQKLAALEEQVKRVRALKPSDASGPPIFGAPPSYWLDLRGYDPALAAKKLAQPLLFIQGGRDYQVTRKDFDRFKTALAGRKNVELRFHDALNHLFFAGQGPSTPADYERLDHVDVRVIDDVARFIEARR